MCVFVSLLRMSCDCLFWVSGVDLSGECLVGDGGFFLSSDTYLGSMVSNCCGGS